MALVRLIRAALVHGVAPVDLAADHVGPGPHVLQLRLDGLPVVVLAAELAGETATGAFALRLAPLDSSHVPELRIISEGDDSALQPSPQQRGRHHLPRLRPRFGQTLLHDLHKRAQGDHVIECDDVT